jgi:lipoprotein-anchoring transpeptidase ErfK/SrfK
MKYIITEHQLNLLKEQWYDPSSWFGGEKTNCSTEKIEASNWKDLYSKLVKNSLIERGEDLLIVWGPTQTGYYTQDGKSSSKTFKVSTGSNGFGNEPDNKQTPMGLLQISGKIKGKPFEVLVGKTPTGTILGPNMDSSRIDQRGKKHVAEVLTGILELSGLEPCNKNAFSRNIYFHGTNKENKLGGAHSNGCVRVSNDEIQWLINNISKGTKVYIYP